MIVLVDNSQSASTGLTPKLIRLTRDILSGLSSNVKVVVVDSMRQLHDHLKDPSHIKGVILSGGPLNLSAPVLAADYMMNVTVLTSLSVPVLGICFGMQAIAACYGGKIVRIDGGPDEGVFQCTTRHAKTSCLFSNVPSSFQCFQAHGDEVLEMPVGFRQIATGDGSRIQAIEKPTFPYRAGTQFHLETSGDVGHDILANFLGLCLP